MTSKTMTTKQKQKSKIIKRIFTKPGVDAYDMLTWKKYDALIQNPGTGEVVFEQKGVEFPDHWSQNAVNIVSQKYFSGELGSPKREKSLKQLINRVADTVSQYGFKNGYFATRAESEVFNQELKYILATQRASFNSPVWFNIGVPTNTQQASACFILSVEDSLPSILNWYVEEGLIFKGGSGSGVNLSPLRSSYETLSYSAGKASGPVSFMRGADASAGTIQSGGKTRRAAKMVILNVDHPDVEAFIDCKAHEERKVRALSEAGFDMNFTGKDIVSVQYQNANNSVRVSDKFMEAAVAGKDWELKEVVSGKTVKTLPANQILDQISQAAWECADPGMQFDDTINYWHTTPESGRINGSNPCSEYMHIDNSACNLASINLLKFLTEEGRFLLDEYRSVIKVMILAQEILVGYSSYPTERITENSKKFRQLGLGYANLGALLMAKGLAYDSDRGRALAASLTAILTGQAYATSARVAKRIGSFATYEQNREATLRVLRQHRDEVDRISIKNADEILLEAAAEVWDEVVDLAERYGVRNSQATVLAPTGTIGLMMDCDTTGIEPDLGLVKVKTLVGGGIMSIVNQTIPRALRQLGYEESLIDKIVDYVEENGGIESAPGFNPNHSDVFACSMGENPIHHLGHIKMMAAVQPFLSGAISKTVNMPNEATVEDVKQLLVESWRLKLKAVAIYRDNCKFSQPLKVDDKSGDEDVVIPGTFRKEMPALRNSKTFKFKIASNEGFVTVGEYDNGDPGEIFMKFAKQGSTMAGIMDTLAISVSHGLQHGIPLRIFVAAFINMSFQPQGLTNDPDIRMSSSIIDYVFRKLAFLYLDQEELIELGIVDPDKLREDNLKNQTKLVDSEAEETPQQKAPRINTKSDAPICVSCGNQTFRSGSCYICRTCGLTTGCS